MSLWHRYRDSGTRTTELPTARCDPHQILTHSDNLGRQALRQPGRSEENIGLHPGCWRWNLNKRTRKKKINFVFTPKDLHTNTLTILVHVRQVDFVAEQYEPLVHLDRGEHDAVRSLAVLAVVVERLQHQLGGGGTGEVQAYHLQHAPRSTNTRGSIDRPNVYNGYLANWRRPHFECQSTAASRCLTSSVYHISINTSLGFGCILYRFIWFICDNSLVSLASH